MRGRNVRVRETMTRAEISVMGFVNRRRKDFLVVKNVFITQGTLV